MSVGRPSVDWLVSKILMLWKRSAAGVPAPRVGDQPLLVQVALLRLLYTARRNLVPWRVGGERQG
jgi:hypothetical protein